VFRSILLMSALSLLTGCPQNTRGTPSKVAMIRPELKVDLREKVGKVVEVTGLLVSVSTDGARERDEWVGVTTVTLGCKGVTLACTFPRAATPPVRFLPGVENMRHLTVRGTVVSVEPAGTATLSDCEVVSDPHKP